MARHTRYQGLILQGGCVLVIRHQEHATGHGYWVIPGGGIEDGESEENRRFFGGEKKRTNLVRF